MGANSLLKTVTRLCRGCDLNPGPSAPESSMLTTRLLSHPSLPPILFIIYTADLAWLVSEHGLSLHQHADDSQIYGSWHSDATSSLSNTVSQCVDSISNWMRSNRLRRSADKTEVIWCSSTRKLSQLPSCPFSCPDAPVFPVSAIRDLCVFIDNDLGMATHVR